MTWQTKPPDNHINLVLENQSLRNEFELRGLNLSQVYCPWTEDLSVENQRIQNLLEWVDAFHELKSRDAMIDAGYDDPPVEPDLSAENDWFIFERWIGGDPVRITLNEMLDEFYLQKDPGALSDEALEEEVEHLTDLLADVNFCVEFHEGVPPRLAYSVLMNILEEEFELLADGWWHIDGCNGHCPCCFQRPWCDSGLTLCWPEDDKAGEIVFTEAVRFYVSPSPVSYELLKKNQAEANEAVEPRHLDEDIPF